MTITEQPRLVPPMETFPAVMRRRSRSTTFLAIAKNLFRQ
jgi:hypothetical protein